MVVNVIVTRPLESIFMFSNYISNSFYKEYDNFVCDDIEDEIAMVISDDTGINKNVIKSVADYTMGQIFSLSSYGKSTTVATNIAVHIH